MTKDKNSTDDVATLKQKTTLSLGLVSDHYASQSVIYMTMPVYNVLLGVNPVLIGFILGFFRLWDAFTDPIIGKISDNFRSKYGRRRPLIALGAISTGISFPLIWLVPSDWGETAKVSYLCVSLLFYYCAYSVYSVSYSSLALETSSSYNERTRLFAFRQILTTALTIGIPWLLAVAYLDIFPSPLFGIKIVGLTVGLIVVVGGVLAAIYNQERNTEQVKKQEKINIFSSFRQLKSNKEIMIVILLMFFKLLELSLTGSLGFYVNSYYVYSGDIKAAAIQSGLISTSALVVTFIASTIIYKLAGKISKEKVILFCMVIEVLGSASRLYTYTPDNPNLMYISTLLLTFSSSIFWVVIISMLSDVCDYDEHQFGIRREGMISALSNWLTKTGMALGLILSGSIISITGFNATSGEPPSSETLQNMHMLFVFIPCFIYMFCIFLIKHYSLSRDNYDELKSSLEVNRSCAIDN